MAGTTLPAIIFESSICIRRYFPAIYGSREEHKLRHDWHIIGRLEDGTPFLLMYSGCGMTNWFCSANLGDSLWRLKQPTTLSADGCLIRIRKPEAR